MQLTFTSTGTNQGTLTLSDVPTESQFIEVYSDDGFSYYGTSGVRGVGDGFEAIV